MGTTFLPVVLRRPQKTADNCCLFGSSRFRCKEVYLSFHFLLVSFFFRLNLCLFVHPFKLVCVCGQ